VRWVEKEWDGGLEIRERRSKRGGCLIMHEGQMKMRGSGDSRMGWDEVYVYIDTEQ
jgi:hypothetical protein